MAAAQVLSPTSPHLNSPFASTFQRANTFLTNFGPNPPSPSVFQAEFRRKDTILTSELPHTAAYADHTVQKDLPHQRSSTFFHNFGPHPPSPSTFQSSFRRKDTIFSSELPHAAAYADHDVQKDLPHQRSNTFKKTFGPHPPSPSTFQSEFRRKDTILTSELPHAAACADHDVQKDLPHQKRTDTFFRTFGPHPPSPSTFQAEFRRKDTVLNTELPHAACCADHDVQKDLPHQKRTDTFFRTFGPHPPSPSTFQTEFRRKDTVLNYELPHAAACADHDVQKDLPHQKRTDTFFRNFGPHPPSPSLFQAQFRRKDTVLNYELPHVAAYADHDVQKDLPHQKTSGHPFVIENRPTKAATSFELLTVDKSNIDAVLEASPAALTELLTLVHNSWKVSAWIPEFIEHVWTTNAEPSGKGVSTDESVLLNLGLTYNVGRHGVVSESLTALAITDDAWDVIISALYARPLTINYESAIPQHIPVLTSEVLVATVRALRNRVLHQPFLLEGETEARSMSSLVPDWDDKVPEGAVWWLPSVKQDEEESKVTVEYEVEELAEDDGDDDWQTIAADDFKQVDDEDDDEEKTEEEEIVELHACLVHDESPLVERFVKMTKASAKAL